MTAATLECDGLTREGESGGWGLGNATSLPAPAWNNSQELIDLAHEALGNAPTRFRLNLAKQLLVEIIREKRTRMESEQF